MKPIAILAALALSACVVVPAPGRVAPEGAPPLPAADCPRPAGLAATNRFRASIGKGQLSHDPRLDLAAQAHACELAARGGELTHEGLNGSTSFERAQRAQFPARLIAENLAWGRMTSSSVVDGWAGSPAHRANMSHPRIEKIGTGVANSPRGPIWVQVMGR